mgnify:CR=1 FL=1
MEEKDIIQTEELLVETDEAVAPTPKKRSWLWPIVAAVILVVMGLTIMLALLGNRVNYHDYVVLGQYKGLVVPIETVSVTDEEVEKAIEANLNAATTYATVNRAAKNGDTVNIDFVGRLASDGTAFEGGSATKFDLILGSGSFIPGFEDGLIGKKAGETVDLPLTFPQDYQSEDLAGVDVVFTVTIHTVKEPVKAELNEEFVKANGKVSTVAEYRQLIHDQLLADKQEQAKSDRTVKIWQSVLDNCEISGYPEAALKVEMERYRTMYEQYASYYGMTLDDFVAANNITNEQFEELLNNWAKSNLDYLMVASVIADAEGIHVTDEEYQAEVDAYLSSGGFASVEEYEAEYNEDFDAVNGASIRNELLINKVVTFLEENTLAE